MLNSIDFFQYISDKISWSKKVVPSKTTLLYEGDLSNKVYYIKKGALRMWNNDDGKDITFQFFFESQIVSSYESFYLNIPSKFSIESIEPTELLIIDKQQVYQLLNDYPEMNNYFIEQLSMRLITYTDYFLSRIKESPEKRYLSLLTQNSDLINRVPDYYIASFLGITPVSLSRIKKRIE
ncbi:Crp/Fnr family transcriptional regulator [Lactococcus kimchii]|uniref:Crp/Fnr family transcriptional regulator n=1 Tax=Lactococcus sp. S-13 TaxID=2507158 RepID=UPI0010233294|nr:Crp/Fnr family transcriptional regulator [Lactococcus sp. S-13]RZI47915.1 Crp/Fnr family transcriptional regulator [Lactococcus sp. S-13]